MFCVRHGRPARRLTDRGRATVLGGLLLALTAGGCDREIDAIYPARPISIICPWAAGGGTDTVSRLMAHLIQEETDQPVSVINRTGGGGVTGHTAGALADPDGYTVLMITVEIAMMHWRGLTDLSYRDFKPVMLINRDAAALFVRNDAPWMSLGELRATVAENPGGLHGSGTALGGIWHVALAGGLMAMGFAPGDIVWVPSNGAAPALQELLSGGIDVAVCSLPEAQSQLFAGEIRCLGVMADERLDNYPDVPTFGEQGIDWSLGGWRGLALPRGASDRRVAQLEEIVERIVRGEAFRREMSKLGYAVAVERAGEFRATMERSDRTLGKVLKASLARSEEGHAGVPGPWFFPVLLATLASVLGLGLAVAGALRSRRPGTAPALAEPAVERPRWGLAIEIVLGVIVYIVAAPSLGFLLTGTLLLLYFFRRLGAPWVQAIVVAILLVPGIYLLFSRVMRVPLPGGILRDWLPL